MQIAKYKRDEYLQEIEELIKIIESCNELGLDIAKQYKEILELKKQIENAENKTLEKTNSNIKLELVTTFTPSFEYKLKEIKETLPNAISVLANKKIELPSWLKNLIQENPRKSRDIINNIEEVIDYKNHIEILRIIPELYNYIPFEDKENNLNMAQIALEQDANLLKAVPIGLIVQNQEMFREAFVKNGIDLDSLIRNEKDLDNYVELKTFKHKYEKLITEMLKKDTSDEGKDEHPPLWLGDEDWQMANQERVAEDVKKWSYKLKYTSEAWQMANQKLVAEIVKEWNYSLNYTSEAWQMANQKLVAKIVKEWDYSLGYTSEAWQMANQELVTEMVKEKNYCLKYASEGWVKNNLELVSEIIENDSSCLENIIYLKDICENNWKWITQEELKYLDVEQMAKKYPVSLEELSKYSRRDVHYLVKAINGFKDNELKYEYIKKITDVLKQEKNNIPTQENMGTLAQEIFKHESKERFLNTVVEKIESEINIIEQKIDKNTATEYKNMLEKISKENTAQIFEQEDLYKKHIKELIDLYSHIDWYIKNNIAPEMLNDVGYNEKNKLAVQNTEKRNIFSNIINKLKNMLRSRKNNDNIQENQETEVKTKFKTSLRVDVDIKHKDKSTKHKQNEYKKDKGGKEYE